MCWPDTCLLWPRSCAQDRASERASNVSSSSSTACTGRSAASGGSTTGVLPPQLLLLLSCSVAGAAPLGWLGPGSESYSLLLLGLGSACPAGGAAVELPAACGGAGSEHEWRGDSAQAEAMDCAVRWAAWRSSTSSDTCWACSGGCCCCCSVLNVVVWTTCRSPDRRLCSSADTLQQQQHRHTTQLPHNTRTKERVPGHTAHSMHSALDNINSVHSSIDELTTAEMQHMFEKNNDDKGQTIRPGFIAQ